MCKRLCFSVVMLFLLCALNAVERDYVIVVHGGAGALSSLDNRVDMKKSYYAALDSALEVGGKVLSSGGKGIDAVVAVIQYLENNPLFNAGVEIGRASCRERV